MIFKLKCSQHNQNIKKINQKFDKKIISTFKRFQENKQELSKIRKSLNLERMHIPSNKPVVVRRSLASRNKNKRNLKLQLNSSRECAKVSSNCVSTPKEPIQTEIDNKVNNIISKQNKPKKIGNKTMLDRLIKNEYNIEKQIKELNLKLDTDYYSFHQRNKTQTVNDMSARNSITMQKKRLEIERYKRNKRNILSKRKEDQRDDADTAIPFSKVLVTFNV